MSSQNGDTATDQVVTVHYSYQQDKHYMSIYRYEIHPRLAELGGGWRLKLLENEEEVGGGVFPADANSDPQAGISWFNSLSEAERARWLADAGSARPADAYATYLRKTAYEEAHDEAEAWLA